MHNTEHIYPLNLYVYNCHLKIQYFNESIIESVSYVLFVT